MHAPPQIMGVINITPDSFSDGGRYFDPSAAIDHGLRLIEDGADILDIGGESTRPGASAVSAAEELDRVLPVIEALKSSGVRLSIDTTKPDVAGAAFRAGAHIWNDISAMEATDALETAARLACPVILMHKQGDPQTMQTAPHYDDVVAEVEAYLLARARAAEAAGIKRDHIRIDPGIGFGKTLDHNLALIRATKRLSGHGYPLVMAASNKRFIVAHEERLGRPPSAPEQRLGGTIATHLYAVSQGASVVRVHDVRAMRQALDLFLELNS